MSIRCQKCDYNNPPDTRFCGGCGTRLSPSTPASASAGQPTQSLTQTLQTGIQELQVGSVFAGRYLILESLGRGGMGRVYRVLDKKLDVEVALKLLRPEVAADPGIIERFKNELKLARAISHPHVCRMYDLSEDQGTHFITMEYVPGEDLKTTVRRVGPLGLPKALALAKQIAEGLAAAHKLDIVHRDLKPQNIMLDRGGQVRIMDFGISRSLRAKGMTADGMMVGTPEYISPEQAEGKKIDARTDIYAFGVILFEMVTGQVPFEGDTTLSIILKHKLEPPPDPKKLNPGLPRELGYLILKCLEKNRDRRYASAQDLLAGLCDVERRLDGKAPTREERERPRLGGKKIPIPALILAGAAALVAGYFLLKPSGKIAAPETPERRADVAETANRHIETAGPSDEQKKAPPVPVPPAATSAKESKSEAGAVPKTTKPVPPAGAAASATLEISTAPAGGDVYLNGAYQGKTPIKQAVAPGAYEVRIKKAPEYREFVDKVTLRAGESLPRHYVLSAVYILELRSVPAGAEAHVNGVLVGRTPVEVELPGSGVEFGLRLGDEWAPISEGLKLKPGRNVVERSLRSAAKPDAKSSPPKDTKAAPPPPPAPLTGRVRFNVLPYAEVFVDGRSIGEVPPVQTLELVEGIHPLKFDSSRLKKSLSMNLTVKPTDRIEVRVNMVSGEMKVLPWKQAPRP
jgi:serine/threonine protein kinase